MTARPGSAGDRDETPSILELAVTGGVPRHALIVAAVVGTILNLIAQGDFLLAGQPLNWYKIALTFVVPYMVSTWGAVASRRRHFRAEQSTLAGPGKA